MVEPPGTVLRPSPVRNLPLVVALAALVALAGCGDAGGDTGTGPGADPGATSPSGGPSVCATAAAPATQVAEVDLDGDGTAEPVAYLRADGACPARLRTTVGGHELVATVETELPVRPADAGAVAFPDRTGQVLLVSAHHPRGGFQASLFGYADGRFEELRAEGQPLLGFVATDTLSTPVATHCVGDGFDVVEARTHQPPGVVAAWDIFRTTYSVDGNEVTKGETVEVAENVLDRRLQREYGDLVDHSLFANCRAGG